MADLCRSLIVASTVVRRQRLTEVLGSIHSIDCFGTAATGTIALRKLEGEKVDLVLVDQDLSDMLPAQFVRTLRKRYPDATPVLLTDDTAASADSAVAALEAGAIDCLPLPDMNDASADWTHFTRRLRAVTQAANTRRYVEHTRRVTQVIPNPAHKHKRDVSTNTTNQNVTLPLTAKTPNRFSVIAIGISTGGPNALAELIPKLQPNLGIPILLVQHMPASFTRVLATSLDEKSLLPVREAIEGEPVKPNTVYLAPGGRHMTVKRSTDSDVSIRLVDSPPRNSCRPAADVLFESVAEVYGGNILAVIMTGMGNDGRAGVAAMKTRGCYCLSQSAESCIVYGMPRAVDEAGLSDERTALANMAGRINALVRPS